jgi:hypothetical protein
MVHHPLHLPGVAGLHEFLVKLRDQPTGYVVFGAAPSTELSAPTGTTYDDATGPGRVQQVRSASARSQASAVQRVAHRQQRHIKRRR